MKIKFYQSKKPNRSTSSCKSKSKKIEINRMRSGYIMDTLASVDIQEILEIGGKVKEICEGVIYRKNFILSLFREVIDKLLALSQNFKDKRRYYAIVSEIIID